MNRTLLLLCVALSLSAVMFAQKDLLKTKYAEIGVAESFRPGAEWLNLPDYDNRAGWEKLLDEKLRTQLVRRGEEYLQYRWQAIMATEYLEFERSGNRYVMQDIWSANRMALGALLYAELAEGKGRFMEQILNGMWYYATTPSWVYSAHTPNQRSHRAIPDSADKLIDLGAGTLAQMLSYGLHFFEKDLDKIDPVVCRDLRKALKREIFDSYLDDGEDICNWWIGNTPNFQNGTYDSVNNWNPWVNTNILISFLLVEQDNDTLHRFLKKSVASVDNFLNYVQSDGACEEGPSYWSHAAGKVWEYLQILYDASGGRFNLLGNERIRRMGEYTSRAYIGGKHYTLNFADAPACIRPSFSIVWLYGKAVNSMEMQRFALLGLAGEKQFEMPRGLGGEMWRDFCLLQHWNEVRQVVDEANARVAQIGMTATLAELRKDVPAATWYDETEVCMVRTADNCYFGAKGGYNGESHNHNDVGTFVFFKDNEPLILDVGPTTYMRQTFTHERYSIWSMQAQWHNLPLINGVQEEAGRAYHTSSATYKKNGSRHTLSLGLESAFPDEAACTSWKRTYQLTDSRRGSSLIIREDYELRKRKAADVEHFLVKGDVELVTPGLLMVRNGNVGIRMIYPKTFTTEVTTRVLDDVRHSSIWGPELKRISLSSATDAPISGSYEIKIEVIR